MTISFNDWADLSPGSITIIADNSTGGFYPVYSGYDAPGEDSGVFPNVIRGKLRLGAGTAHVLLDGVDNFISIGDTPPIVYGNNEGIWMGLDGGVPKMSVYKDANNYFKFDGTNVTIGGAITATSGAIGGWTIGATTLSSANITLDSGNDKITVNTITIDGANDRIRSSNYATGVNGAGFTLEPDLLEVGNIACRGIFRTGVFQKDVISAVGGNVAISKGADVLATDMSALDASTLTIEGNETFAVGDMLRIKDGAEDEWLEVTNDGSAPTYTVTRDKDADYGADSNPTWKKGACVINYGASGDGLIYMTASETNAPYMSVYTHAGSPWSTLTERMRFGNLNGYLGYSTDKYGVAIGETNKYLKYDPTNGMRIKGILTIESTSSGILSFSDAGDLAATNEVDADVLNMTNAPAEANADVTSTHTAADASTYTGASIAVGNTDADVTADNAQNIGWLIGSTGTLTISSSGKLSLNTADALEIQAAGNIKVLAGGDIELLADAADPGLIKWLTSGEDIEMGQSLTGVATGDFAIRPTTDAGQDFYIGSRSTSLWWDNNVRRFLNIYLQAQEDVNLSAYDDTNNYGQLNVGKTGDITLTSKSTGTLRLVVFNNDYFAPHAAYTELIDLGQNTRSWDDAYAVQWLNPADFYILDEKDDLATIMNIKSSGKIDERTGLPLIDDNTLPEWMVVRDKNTKKIVYNPDGKPWVSNKMYFSLLTGMGKQLGRRTEDMMIQIRQLTQRITTLETQIV